MSSTYTRTTKRPIGTSLQIVLPSRSIKSVQNILGKPDADGYYEPEKGYEGEEYVFEGDEGEFVTLYSRWGEYRIGAYNLESANSFKLWYLKLVADTNND